jgi:hypothetical protein
VAIKNKDDATANTIAQVLTQKFTNAIGKVHVPKHPSSQESQFIIVMGNGTVGLETTSDDQMPNALQEFIGTISMSWSILQNVELLKLYQM